MVIRNWNKDDIRNGYPIIPQNERKKILLLSDDIRMHSGVATMSRELVQGTCHHFNWVQIAAAIKHPDTGKIINMNDYYSKETGIKDCSVTLYPFDGYGNQQILSEIINREKPDILLNFTDPRQFIWLFEMEHTIRNLIPTAYYNIWDQPPIPQYNRSYYKSCDLIMNINRQTKLFVEQAVLSDNKTKVSSIDRDEFGKTSINKLNNIGNNSLITSYVPHGINKDIFKPLKPNKKNSKYKDFYDFKNKILGNKKYDFVLFFNSRNIRRKQVSDLLISYKFFCQAIGKEKADKTLLILKTAPIDNNGTDLPKLHHDLLPECNIKFIDGGLSPKQMNYLYNISDVELNPSSAEGFGLSCAEAIMSGTPVIPTVIGGLQDQMRFSDENNEWDKLDIDHFANSDGKYKNCGKWAFPLFPDESIQGSPPTPYIYDSRPKIKDICNRMLEVYNLSSKERKERGLAGREWLSGKESRMSSEEMCSSFIHDIDYTLTNWTPKDNYIIEKIEKDIKINKVGLFNPLTKEWM